ncbi:MAG TPA: OmpA family protein [Limnobacter sp.]|uniref:OmpA family protein n=1 Tax=Limnobacter sp. TaxID=2003368 RepID=UPI002EDA30C8
MHKLSAVPVICTCVLTSLLASCATYQRNNGGNPFTGNADPCASYQGRVIATVLTGLLGSVIGHEMDKTGGAIKGAAAGAALGYLIGRDIDQRNCELFKIAQTAQMELSIQTLKASSLDKAVGSSVSIQAASAQFASNASTPTPEAQRAFRAMANQYFGEVPPQATAKDREAIAAARQKMRIFLVGHTDDTGSSERNAELSEARAREVAKIFEQAGFDRAQIFYQGAGETLPAKTNLTAEGRAANRRVEIVDLATEADFATYLSQRVANPAYFRAAAIEPPTDKPQGGATGATSGSVGKPAAPTKQPKRKEATGVAAAPSKAPASPQLDSGIDFGGEPVKGRFSTLNIGSTQSEGLFSLISSAQADDSSPVQSCSVDRPRISRGVKALQNDQPRKPSVTDYLPNLYGTAWTGSANGHLLAVTNVAVLKDGGLPAQDPTVLIYKNYDSVKGAQADIRQVAKVNTYRGDRGLLYRVFLKGRELDCIDFVMSDSASGRGVMNVLYTRRGELYQKQMDTSKAKS